MAVQNDSTAPSRLAGGVGEKGEPIEEYLLLAFGADRDSAALAADGSGLVVGCDSREC
jgi:hypothetical protein